jgi:hypothetical protein
MTAPASLSSPADDRKNRFPDAFSHYRALLLLAVAYALFICGECYIYAVPPAECLEVLGATYSLISKILSMLLFAGVYYFFRRLFDGAEKRAGASRLKHAWRGLNAAAENYFSGRLFAYALVGLVAVLPVDFFFIQKSLQPVISPYHWDPVLAVWDKAVHFGHTPNDLMMALAQKAGFLGVLFSDAYFAWFGAMFAILGYSLLADRDLKRRLRYLWVFVLAWIVVGSVMANVFSSVGPIFYHAFYPRLPDPYAALRAYVDKNGEENFLVVFYTIHALMAWATNGKAINPSVISAMPSMHMAIAWLNVLYCFRLNKYAGLAALLFAVLIYGATMLFGFHYGLDIYFSILLMSLMWWLSGRIADKLFGKDNNPRLMT